ncbi:LOW QUALITY PROTEIN: hypothetical protein U9M48_002175 [Paspalum notatum var. saurae]|uniref:Reverse transcriptase Ty1/copia-type domain-containing protein n=1 Tax=Paspalum notatum var. saurae TaxID=547442 RepID=A0AAQ3PKJ1_PASNO
MEDEMRSMCTNKVWDLEEIPKGAKTVGCKWVYKTKRDSKGNIDRHKARIIMSFILKPSRLIIMALIAHYDLELHQMDVKTAFLNGELYENVFMAQPKGFVVKEKENLGCRLKISIYGLKQASRQSFDFKENIEDNCIYTKFKNGKFIFLVLYVDDILLASSDMNLLLETKNFLSSNFDTKDLREASYVLGIEIHRDRRKGVLGLSQKAYIENILKKYSMYKCKASPVPIGDVFGNFQCPKNKYEIDRIKSVPYALPVGNIMYAQVCIRLDLAFTRSCLKNLRVEYWIAVKKTLWYLRGTKSLMLTYRKSNALEIVGYSDANMAGCRDTRKSMSSYIFTLAGEPFRGRTQNNQLLHRQQSTLRL